MKLKDRVAVVTGAGSGIGRACAREFAREGARVVVADINDAGAEETVKQIAALGGQAMAVPTDVADPASVQRLLQATLEAYKHVHVLCSNAAIQVNKTVEDTTVEEWNRENGRERGRDLSLRQILPAFSAAHQGMHHQHGFRQRLLCGTTMRRLLRHERGDHRPHQGHGD